MTELPTPPSPHVVVVTCHDLGRHLGCYGVETVRTPHLDALAAAGVRFEHAFSTASGCSPARAALATGRYPHSNGVMGLTHPPFFWDLHPGEQHVAGILDAAGYDTHLFGFQHVSTSIERLGFNQIHGRHGRVLGGKVSDQVADFLRGDTSDKPLYIEINLEEPHRPYDQGGARPDDALGVFVPPYLPRGPAAEGEMAAMQGAIRQADAAVGRILASLDDAGMRQNTLVIFLADHGIAMPRAKCTLYDPGVEIALIVRWPGGIAGEGRVLSEMISNVDVLPTLLEAVGVPVPEPVQGRSFLPLLRGEPYVARTAVYAEKTYHSYYDPMRAIRTERFKYIRNFESAPLVEVPADIQLGAIFRAHLELYHFGEHRAVELYDLDADPLEQRNLAGDVQLAQVERWLATRLRTWMIETDDPLLEGPVASPSYRRAREAENALAPEVLG